MKIDTFFEKITNELKCSIQLNKQQDKMYRDWFDIEDENQTMRRILFWRLNEKLKEDYEVIGKPDSMLDLLIIYNVFCLVDEKRISEDLIMKYHDQFCFYFDRFGFYKKELYENVKVKDVLESINDEIIEIGWTHGYTPMDCYYTMRQKALLKVVFQDSLIRKQFIKECEKELSELLGVKNYKIIGLKTLSRFMEKVWKRDKFDSFTKVDHRIAIHVFLLMCLLEPLTISLYSCYFSFILEKMLDIEREENQDYRASLYFKNGSYVNMDAIIKYIEESDEEWESLKIFHIAIDSEKNRDCYLNSMFSLCQQIQNNREEIEFNINIGYKKNEWKKKSLKEQAEIVIALNLHYRWIREVDSYRDWYDGQIQEIKIVENKQEVIENKEEVVVREVDSVKELKRQIQFLNQKNRELKKENYALKNQNIENVESNSLTNEEKDELNHLRQFVFQVSQEENQMQDLSKDWIGSVDSIVIVGGHSTLQRKLMSKYNNIFCIDGRKRVSFDVIENADIVFFLFDFLSHSSYYQGVNACQASHVPFGYIQGTNLERAEQQMIETIKKEFV
ncbi:DUF2325 domain-containing protein [Floccifex sp.]|uniref:DUF2325 domain-containing protein n=1 Tax=Floccifex sp. TaxID=2815810 RepID=UPI003EFEDB7B